MKKLAIASASMALAAMPMVGVFAADPVTGDVSVKDNVTVVINESCTFQATQGTNPVDPSQTNNVIERNFRKSATLGSLVYLGDGATGGSGAQGTPITIQGVCNSGQSGSAKTGTWSISAIGDNGAKMVKSGATGSTDDIAAGTETSGTTSKWAMRIGSTGDFFAVPASSTEVASGQANGTAFAFEPQYQVYVGTAQASGTYTGVVTYTIASTWSGN